MRALRLVLFTAALSMGLVTVAHAGSFGSLDQHRIPTDDSRPRHIANGSDGNRWFTETSEFLPAAIGRITPEGDITEFGPACPFCILTDIAQGPADVLYFTSNDPILGRITTAGEFMDPIPLPHSNAVAGDMYIDGDDVWITDFNNDSIWRYDIGTGQFTEFDTPQPGDVTVDAAGIVWFTATFEQAIGRLDPATGAITLTPTGGFPRQITIATDGMIWWSERFTPQAVGRLDPDTNTVTKFPVTDVGPEGIAASPDGSVWFTQTTAGNIARITNDGVITTTRVVKNSEPFGITVDPEGDPWYVMAAANKVAEFELRR